MLVPEVAPAATANELQQLELMDDALVAEGVEYALSDDSLSLTEEDDDDVPVDELVGIIPAEGYTAEPLSDAVGDTGPSVADAAVVPALPPTLPDSSVPSDALSLSVGHRWRTRRCLLVG